MFTKNTLENHAKTCRCSSRSNSLPKHPNIKISNMSLYHEHFHLLKSWKRGLPRWPLGGPLGAKFMSKNVKYLSRIAYLVFSFKTHEIINIFNRYDALGEAGWSQFGTQWWKYWILAGTKSKTRRSLETRMRNSRYSYSNRCTSTVRKPCVWWSQLSFIDKSRCWGPQNQLLSIKPSWEHQKHGFPTINVERLL